MLQAFDWPDRGFSGYPACWSPEIALPQLLKLSHFDLSGGSVPGPGADRPSQSSWCRGLPSLVLRYHCKIRSYSCTRCLKTRWRHVAGVFRLQTMSLRIFFKLRGLQDGVRTIMCTTVFRVARRKYRSVNSPNRFAQTL